MDLKMEVKNQTTNKHSHSIYTNSFYTLSKRYENTQANSHLGRNQNTQAELNSTSNANIHKQSQDYIHDTTTNQNHKNTNRHQRKNSKHTFTRNKMKKVYSSKRKSSTPFLSTTISSTLISSSPTNENDSNQSNNNQSNGSLDKSSHDATPKDQCLEFHNGNNILDSTNTKENEVPVVDSDTNSIESNAVDSKTSLNRTPSSGDIVGEKIINVKKENLSENQSSKTTLNSDQYEMKSHTYETSAMNSNQEKTSSNPVSVRKSSNQTIELEGSVHSKPPTGEAKMNNNKNPLLHVPASTGSNKSYWVQLHSGCCSEFYSVSVYVDGW